MIPPHLFGEVDIELFEHKIPLALIVLVVERNPLFQESAANKFQQNMLRERVGGDIDELLGNNHFTDHLGRSDGPGHPQSGGKGFGG